MTLENLILLAEGHSRMSDLYNNLATISSKYSKELSEHHSNLSFIHGQLSAHIRNRDPKMDHHIHWVARNLKGSVKSYYDKLILDAQVAIGNYKYYYPA